jgi:hypothetical protein
VTESTLVNVRELPTCTSGPNNACEPTCLKCVEAFRRGVQTGRRKAREHQPLQNRKPFRAFVDWIVEYKVTTQKWGHRASKHHDGNIARDLIDMVQHAVRDGELTHVNGFEDLRRFVTNGNMFGWSEKFRPCLQLLWNEYERRCGRRP